MTDKSEIERLKDAVGDHQFHHIECDAFSQMKIEIGPRGRRHPEMFDGVAISSSRSIAEGLKACQASPFQTVFVVRVETGEVLFALSQNDGYVTHARKKRPAPDPSPPQPPISDCCQLCSFMGGTGCDDIGDGSCICFGSDRTTDATISDPLERLAF